MRTIWNQATRRKTQPAWLVVLSVIQVFLLIHVARAGISEPGPPGSPAGPSPQSIEQQWGVKVLGIHRTAAGYMLDFRYRVLDPVKATLLFDLQIKPCLTDQATGARMMVISPPKLGAMRSSGKNILPDRNYFIMFANPGQFIKTGNKVTVEIGAFRVTDLVVQ